MSSPIRRIQEPKKRPFLRLGTKMGPKTENRVGTLGKKPSGKLVSHTKYKILLEECKAGDALGLAVEITHFKASPNPN